MDKASVTVTTTPRTDTVPPSSSQLQLDTDREVNNKSLASSTTPDTDPVKFVPSLGSWAKQLFFKPPATPPEPSTPQGYDPAIVGNQLASMWPTFNDEILNKQLKSKHPTRSLQPPIEKLPPPELKVDGSLRFPWAARLSPQSRNLYRAATPTYRLDGTPEVSIPSKVLWLGPENKDGSIIGKFHRCSLPPREGCSKIPEISTLPVWVTLKNLPDCCYSRLGISHVASRLGPWIPSTCERCGNLGHKEKRCLLSSKPLNDNLLSMKDGISDEIPVVDIDPILNLREKDPSTKSSPQKNPTAIGTLTTSTTVFEPSSFAVSHIVSDSEMSPHFPSSAQIDPQPQHENNTILPNLSNTLPPLVDSQSAPIQTTIIETSPSNNPLTTTPQAGAFESPYRFTVLRVMDEVETDPKSSFSLTRGGREIKPPIKYQDMEWKTMQGRGKHGRRGRGSSH
ncbi:hypothetical protein F2Q69_00008274 [Brassica cretica]|uniref:CCHC-type domain-containing protein n=1 Tax=Brassica cretica TaxID=69181 RepID=A0A8S9P5C2_BRACR|nr:hypothetical protein F2Q69_00008274 [Brassica cretica]